MRTSRRITEESIWNLPWETGWNCVVIVSRPKFEIGTSWTEFRRVFMTFYIYYRHIIIIIINIIIIISSSSWHAAGPLVDPFRSHSLEVSLMASLGFLCILLLLLLLLPSPSSSSSSSSTTTSFLTLGNALQ